MSEKIERYNTIANEVNELNPQVIIVGTDSDAELEAASLIRELRQAIERLRRVVDDEQPPIEVHSLRDAMKLNKDELAFLALQFFEWMSGEECPAYTCKDFPCQHRRRTKADLEEELKKGDIDEATMEDQKKNGFYACYCDGNQLGCWAEYYLWCYRNGYNPLNGKKEK